MNLAFLCGIKYEDIIYFSGISTNALFSFDCRTHEIRFIKAFEKEAARWLNHRMALTCGDSIWFVPWEGKYLARFRIETSEIEYFELPVKGTYAYWEATTFGDEMLYLIPSGRETNSLIRINTETSEMEDLGNVLPEGGAAWCIGTYLENGKIHFISTDGEVCAIYDINTKRNEIIGTPHSGVYQSIVKCDDNYLLVPFRMNEARLKNYQQNTMKSFICKGTYVNGMCFGKKLSMFPYGANRAIAQIPAYGNDSAIIYKDLNLRNNLDEPLHMSAVSLTGMECWVSTSYGELLMVDDELNIKERYCLLLDDEEIEKLKNNPSVNNAMKDRFMNIASEGMGYLNLQTFIDVVSE